MCIICIIRAHTNALRSSEMDRGAFRSRGRAARRVQAHADSYISLCIYLSVFRLFRRRI